MSNDGSKDSELSETIKHLDKEIEKISGKFEKFHEDFKVVNELKIEVKNLERNLDRNITFIGVGSTVIAGVITVFLGIFGYNLLSQNSDIAQLGTILATVKTEFGHHRDVHEILEKTVAKREIRAPLPDRSSDETSVRFEDMKRQAEQISQQINKQLDILEREGFIEKRPVGG